MSARTKAPPENVQWIVWPSPRDFRCARHRVLQVANPAAARAFLGRLSAQGVVTFADAHEPSLSAGVVNIGFTFRGLEALGLAEPTLQALRQRTPGFALGAPERAAARLGDTGRSAVERWHEAFGAERAHVVLTLHADDDTSLDELERRLRALDGEGRGLSGWHESWTRLDARHFAEAGHRRVHFGYRDGITNLRIVEGEPQPDGLAHRPGELLLCRENDTGFDPLEHEDVPASARDFLRDGSFGVLRMIQQHEQAFNRYLDRQCRQLQARLPGITTDYLKAKICGRWPDGVVVKPTHGFEQPRDEAPDAAVDFRADDADGAGCPFGAHIRRTNPRNDPIAPARLRPLFRRGVPYGEPFRPDETAPEPERGLMGLFFCASIEDQFETVMSEWVEKMPMGPPSQGDAKDPLIGAHDDGSSTFHIPRRGEPPIVLAGFDSFTTARGTLYALYPSREGLHGLAGHGAAPPGGHPDVDEPSAGRDPGSSTSRGAAAGRAPGPVPGSSPAAAAAPDHRAEAKEPPADRFCDIVMEGGVTSGIIYTTAVQRLSEVYRFHGIAGSSIGAFAAALTAAAEFRRRAGSAAGFDEIGGMPARLGALEDDKTLLFRLFRPQESTRRLFEIFLAALAQPGVSTAVRGVLCAAMRQYWRPLRVALLITVLVVLSGPLAIAWLQAGQAWPSALRAAVVATAAWAPALVLLALAVVAATLAWCLGREILGAWMDNGYGLCRGWSSDEELGEQADLAGYLHIAIQKAAGRHPLDDAPLTFKDLWEAKGSPAAVLGLKAGSTAQRAINLEIYATNLSHGRPYRFPLDEGDGPVDLCFDPQDLKPYFPRQVLRHLIANSESYVPGDAGPGSASHAKELRWLPHERLPIVVAVRMAMSFPVLISAVPLWALDREGPGAPRPARCWMSDGGICSNFPIHLFDSFVPEWPTFGIALKSRHEAWPRRTVWLPDAGEQGGADIWDHGMADGRPRSGRLVSFLWGIFRSAWSWNDQSMMLMPGVRDRVVRAYLKPGEGGVNIRMSPEEIRSLAEVYGKAAAEAIIERFASPASHGWDNHRWGRFNALLVALGDRLAGFTDAVGPSRHSKAIAELIRQTPTSPWERMERGPGPWLDESQKRELSALLQALGEAGRAFDAGGDQIPDHLRPRPALRVRHPL